MAYLYRTHMARPPVLVTGATGNVGSHVTGQLLQAGVTVRAAGSSADGVRRMFGDSVQAVALDFTDPGTWALAYDGVKQMFLMRPPQLGKPKKQMLPSLDAAKSAGVTQVVFLSLQGAESNKVVPHAAIEEWLRSSGMSWTFVRAAFFMQNLSTTHAPDIRDRDEIVGPAGGGATGFVDVADVAALATAALLDAERHHERAWTPTGRQALTYTRVAEILTTTLGRPIRYSRPGMLRYVRHARSTLHLPWGMVAVTTAIYTMARLGQAARLTDDVHIVTGQPPTAFKDFALSAAAAWTPQPRQGPV